MAGEHRWRRVRPSCPRGWRRQLCGVLLGLALVGARAAPGDDVPLPPRVLPPAGTALAADDAQQLETALSLLEARLAAVRESPLRPDIEVFAKAVRYALRHAEFYGNQDLAKARWALDLANARLKELVDGQASWTAATGLVVRGYQSRIDGSVQPYGLMLPAELERTKPVPLYVWLHGRGDKQTDLHFLYERHTRPGQITPPGAIVLHPFGRHCLGFKSAGEIDVLEAVHETRRQYRIDPERIVLIGFSMGGAGAWHLGAHYTDHWCAVSPGAGFAETAQYNKLEPAQYPPRYEQRLWGLYDVPNYVLDLFNVPVIAYSGERDKQIQAAQIMEAAFAAAGRRLDHRIGPGVEHQYEPATLERLLDDIRAIVDRGKDRAPREAFVQTQTLRYARQQWLEVLGLDEHWRDSRVTARLSSERRLVVTTRNVNLWRATPPGPVDAVVIDDQPVDVPVGTRAQPGQPLCWERAEGRWRLRADLHPDELIKRGKSPGRQGPIDDAFLEPFLVVGPTGPGKSRDVDRWVVRELAHLDDRWRSVFRGELPRKSAEEVTDDDLAHKHLVLFGDPESNPLIARIHGRLPIHWPNGQVQVGDRRFPADRHVPALIYPNPLHPDRYVVLNSGPTFRAAHDRTNSLQNPKLPDWAILDVTQPPDTERAGRVVAADFFDEHWELRRETP